MGFNNGYDSGYSDCEAENRKKWEEAAVAKYIANGSVAVVAIRQRHRGTRSSC